MMMDSSSREYYDYNVTCQLKYKLVFGIVCNITVSCGVCCVSQHQQWPSKKFVVLWSLLVRARATVPVEALLPERRLILKGLSEGKKLPNTFPDKHDTGVRGGNGKPQLNLSVLLLTQRIFSPGLQRLCRMRTLYSSILAIDLTSDFEMVGWKLLNEAHALTIWQPPKLFFLTLWWTQSYLMVYSRIISIVVHLALKVPLPD